MLALLAVNVPALGRAAEPVVTRSAVFAAGCFWCAEAAFDGVPGVSDVVSGFSGGHVADPTYEQVSRGGTGHVESVEVRYDPRKISYSQLLDLFWRNVDVFDGGGQFCDRGDSYRAVIFVGDSAERQLALASKGALEKRFGRPLAVSVAAAAKFYRAEEYHQDYHTRNPLRYRFYRSGCGRDARLDAIWGPEARGEQLPWSRNRP
jgi:peptide-methionine (S)-S-oxide reductase